MSALTNHGFVDVYAALTSEEASQIVGWPVILDYDESLSCWTCENLWDASPSGFGNSAQAAVADCARRCRWPVPVAVR